MTIAFEESNNGESSAGGSLGNTISFTLGFPSDGNVAVLLIEQDNPGTAISMTTTGWTTLESVNLGHGVAQWLGYRYWHTGDSSTLPAIETTQPCSGALQVFSGTDSGISPLHGQRTVATSESPIECPSVTDTSAGEGNIGFAAIARYNQVGSGNAFSIYNSELDDFIGDATSAGGNASDSGRAIVLGYTSSTHPVGSDFGPFHYTPFTTVDANCQAHAFTAIFFAPITGFTGWVVGEIRVGG